MKKINILAFICVRHCIFGAGLIFAVWACARPAVDSSIHGPVAEKVETIRVTPTKVWLSLGQTLQLSATLGDAAGNMLPGRTSPASLVDSAAKKSLSVIGDSQGRTGRIVTWHSSHPTRVGVDTGGLVTALAVGDATISATSDERSGAVKVNVTEPATAPVSVIPASASLSVGETLLFKSIMIGSSGELSATATSWKSDQPSLVVVSSNGLAKAIKAGTATITASSGGYTGHAVVMITPATTIHGLDFPGNAGVSTTMRFEFKSPLAAYPATYIWRVYPRQQQSYYTAFFWGNNGAFFSSNTYYGFHPYPDWDTAHQHFWEIAAAPGGDYVSPQNVVYDRWYLQVAVCRMSGGSTVYEYYWDWPDSTRMVRHTGKPYDDPPMPVLVVGDAPWNHGNEVWDGVMRGFQFYDIAMTRDEIAQEIVSPGSVRKPWYLNLNPMPSDISDYSGNGHHPAWVGVERPSQWTGTVIGDAIIRTVVSPR